MGFRWAWARLLVGLGLGFICQLDLGLTHLLVGLELVLICLLYLGLAHLLVRFGLEPTY